MYNIHLEHFIMFDRVSSLNMHRNFFRSTIYIHPLPLKNQFVVSHPHTMNYLS